MTSGYWDLAALPSPLPGATYREFMVAIAQPQPTGVVNSVWRLIDVARLARSGYA
jgi:hypothetical protein